MLNIETLSDDTSDLRRIVRDLVALSVLPAVWIGYDARRIVESVAETLASALHLDLIYLQISVHASADSLQVVRTAQSPPAPDHAQLLGAVLAPYLQVNAQSPPPFIPNPFGSGEVRIATIPIGYASEFGALIAGSRRADFPTEHERLLLRVGANQAAILLQHKRAEEQLRRSERELSDFFENATVGLHWVGPDGTILRVNQAELDMLGYRRAEYVGHHIAEFHADQAVIDNILQKLASGEALHEREARLRCKDGSIKYVVIDSNVLWEDDKFVHTRCFTRDITERKRAIEETQRALARAEASEQRLKFLAEASAILSASLDYQMTLQSLARLLVPAIADWCMIDRVDEAGQVTTIELTHRNAQQEALLHALRHQSRPERAWPNHPLSDALRTQKSVLRSHVSDEQRQSIARDAEYLGLLQTVGLSSFMVVPLFARERIVGMLSLVMGESGRHYSDDDLALAEDLARRAALCVDNAWLYQEAQQLNRELDQRVAERTAQLLTANKQLRALSRHLQSAREEERTQIAREIHDELGQQLTALKIDLTMFGRKRLKTAADSQPEAAADIEAMIGVTDQIIRSIRNIVKELRPEILDELGLKAAIEWQVEEFQARTGIECALHATLDALDFDSDHSIAMFRILQESLTNVARHAGATRIDVELRHEPGAIVLAVRDNGRGISETELSTQKSFGLLGMRERALLLGGEVLISGAAGQGTVVMLRVPA